jgi:hypothetical protein
MNEIKKTNQDMKKFQLNKDMENMKNDQSRINNSIS